MNLERSLVQHILMISGCPILTPYHPTIILHIGNVEARYTPQSLFEIIVLIRFLKMASQGRRKHCTPRICCIVTQPPQKPTQQLTTGCDDRVRKN